MEYRKFELLYPQDRIARRIGELGQQISDDYKDKNPILIGILKGCIIFMADLIRSISVPMELEFISASSYKNGRVASDQVVMGENPDVSLSNRHLLMVEGVVDSGKTIYSITEKLKLEKPASIEVVTLLDKPRCRKVAMNIKYVGFDAGSDFVIGFGLDVDQNYRNLPFIGKVTE
ncbi:MAG: hypoxanthine phosphoribosyltransferase [Candidatus Zixiibacteriota bacterium]|nr:MAG: hypoxanthine phosphoribosyltransferase [candidate division Zixibacteria bacterium]